MTAKSLLRDVLIRCMAPLSDRAYRERPRVRVISFHDIPERARDNFRDKVRWLSRNCDVVSLAAACDRPGLDERRLNVALTFDDGFEEHRTFVAPLLTELGLPATFFVPSGSIDLSPEGAERFAKDGLRRRGSFRFMGSSVLEELAGEPLFEVGGHTAGHVDLGQLTDEAGLTAEIVHDKAALEQVVGRPVRWFAFPFGTPENVSARALRAIEDAGYRAAFTIVPSFWSSGQDRYLVGRDCLSLEESDESWERLLRGGYDAISRMKYRRRLKVLERRR